MKTLKLKKPSKLIISQIHSLSEKKGMIAAIEPETNEWFLGKNIVEAFKNARLRYPQSIFYFIRVGHDSAHGQKGGIKKV